MRVRLTGRPLVCCAALVAAQAISASVAAAQEVAPQEAVPTLQLFSQPVTFDGVVYVNGMLESPGERVLELHQTIEFPHDKLQFTSARLGFAGDLAGATLAVEMRNRKGEKVEKRELAQLLDVRIAAKAPLGEGPVLELKFRVVEAKVQNIPITHRAEAFGPGGVPVTDLAFTDGEVVVTETVGPLAPVVFGCFFYMH